MSDNQKQKVYVVHQSYFYRKESSAEILGVYTSLDNAWQKVVKESEYYDTESINHFKTEDWKFVPYPDEFDDLTDVDITSIVRYGNDVPKYGWMVDPYNGHRDGECIIMNGIVLYFSGMIERVFDDGDTTNMFTITPKYVED